MRRATQTIVAAGWWLGCLASSQGDTFIVTTANSLGTGSLYEAINAANAHPGADTIGFNIPGGGVHEISVGKDGLPEITDPVTIDGYLQPGAKANALAVGDDAIILIRIDGSYAGDPPHHGLIISAGNCVIRGLALTGFPTVFNGITGEVLFNGTSIILQEKSNNLIEGNAIGFSSDELLNGFNSIGISVSSSGNTIGGVLPAQRNVISHNNVGVSLGSGANGSIVFGNYMGTDPTGAVEMSNGDAVIVFGTGVQIGGLVPEAANLISGNFTGVYIGALATENVVEGNVIGTDVTGTLNLGNSTAGVTVTGSHNVIGGLEPGAGNRIWFNGAGVVVREIDVDHPAVGNAILSNSITNFSYPIDLVVSGDVNAIDGPTRNDLGDGDSGSNNLQNFPIITSTGYLFDRTTVQGGLSSTPSTTFTLQFFTAGLRASESGLLGTETITTNAAGLAYFSFDFRPLPFDLIVAATVTDPDGNTSEFSNQGGVQLANISTRAEVGTLDDILISGFVVHRPPGGPSDYTKKVLLRALGPSLAVDGVALAGRLENPTLELHDASGAVLASNDDWRSDQAAEIAATGAAPLSDAEAALIADLPDGAYTVQVRGAGGTSGIGVTEVYDLEPLDPLNEPPSGRLVNISTRGLIGSGDNPLIGGLIVRGDDAENVLIRAIGPDLIGQVPNAVSDTTLEVRDGSGALLAFNDNWRDEQEAEIAATGIAPNDDRDAAVLFSMIPGSYTAIVRGKANTAGVGLVEVYDLNLGH